MDFQQRIIDLLIQYGVKIISALIVLIIGLWVIKLVLKIIENFLNRSKIDTSLHLFIKSLLKISLKIVLFITAAAILGIPMTTFIAVLSAAGLAIALALKDNLSNFAGGVLILIFHPFKVEDYIETQGYQGAVKEIQLLYTYLTTFDNKTIIIPNGELSNSKVINYTAESIRRVDLVFSISYKDDIIKAKQVLAKIVQDHSLTLEDPEPMIRVTEHASSSINIAVKAWCQKDDYWTVYYDLLEEVKIVFDNEGINIPFPQMDIHLQQS